MALLTKYVGKIYTHYFLLSVTAFSGTYLLIDFLDKVDDFVDKSIPISVFATYFLSSLPLFFVRVAPIAILMAAFMTIGNLSKTGEITAMRAGGLSLVRIARPLIYITLMITIGIVLVQEIVMPITARTMKDIWNIQIKGEKGPQSVRDKLWFRSGNQMVYIGQAMPGDGLLREVTIFDLNDRFNIVERTDAERAEFKNGAWQFADSIERRFDPKSGEITQRSLTASPAIVFKKTPDDFKHVEATLGELTFLDLYRKIDLLQAEGYSTTRHQVDMHNHITAPFSCLVMVLLGIPFALHRGRSASLAAVIVISVLIGVTYFILNSVSTVFGYSGILSPVIATWAGNIIFALIGIWFILFRTE